MILVRDIMTHEVKTVSAEEKIGQAAKRMVSFKIGSLIIVNNDKPGGHRHRGRHFKSCSEGPRSKE